MLRSILNYCNEIDRDLNKAHQVSKESEMTGTIKNSIAMCLLAIGEEIRNGLSEQLKEKYSNINWYRYVRIRNDLAHAYFNFQEEDVLQVAGEIRQLHDYCQFILSDLR
ncbi:HepT-like ribonuclease domain-containing protein [Enterococcus sp. LJL90]